MTDRYWRDAAACRLADAGLFGPPSGDERQPGVFEARWGRAAAICRTCPVVVPCLQEGRRSKSDGIFAGLLLEGGKVTGRRGPKAGAA